MAQWKSGRLEVEGIAGSRLTRGTGLCHWARHFIGFNTGSQAIVPI